MAFATCAIVDSIDSKMNMYMRVTFVWKMDSIDHLTVIPFKNVSGHLAGNIVKIYIFF